MPPSFEQIGVPFWLADQLSKKPFRFDAPLPVQAAVVPFALKAFSSWLLHCDVCLSSPTGSGKTLCYVLPLLSAIVQQRDRFRGGFPDRHVRGVVVVPTAILAEQVNDVLKVLASSAELVVGTLFRASDDGSNLSKLVDVNSINSSLPSAAANSSSNKKKKPLFKRFGTVDIIVATPQKLCTWIERLADEDDLDDVDEEDDISSIGIAASGGIRRDNNNMSKSHNRRQSGGIRNAADAITDVFGRTQVVVLDEADDLLSTSFFTSMAGRIVETISGAVQKMGETVLHKMMCSATLTSRISKVSDVKLQNAKYFALDASGVDYQQQQQQLLSKSTSSSSSTGAVRALFPLPSSLVEHLVIVRDDSKRHVTLLTTVRHALAELKKQQQDEEMQKTKKDAAAAAVTGGELEPANTTKSSSSSWRKCGSSVIVFCQTAEIARVMGHFLAVAGIDALELTTLSSDAERRQAALAVATAAGSQQKVVVVSDALMRGIDMPGVGAVVMYDPPTTLQQYIHRVGRTARAGAPGASYVLLSKTGASGTEADGQVAHFKSFDAMLLRNGKVFNQVKLRELPDEEVARADELLVKMQQVLHTTGGLSVSVAAKGSKKSAAATEQQQAAGAVGAAGSRRKRNG